MLERHEVETFLALREELHFGRTAERLRLSTARVSQTIARPERRLGVRLFERPSRSVRPTDAAVQLYDELLPAWGRITAAARRVAAGPGATGTLTVAYVDPATSQLLVRVGAAVGRTLPACDVRIREAQPAQVVPWLRDGVVDVAFDVLPLPETGIVTGPVLVSEARMLAVPADHAFADRSRVRLDDLAGIPVLQPPEGVDASPCPVWAKSLYSPISAASSEIRRFRKVMPASISSPRVGSGGFRSPTAAIAPAKGPRRSALCRCRSAAI